MRGGVGEDRGAAVERDGSIWHVCAVRAEACSCLRVLVVCVRLSWVTRVYDSCPGDPAQLRAVQYLQEIVRVAASRRCCGLRAGPPTSGLVSSRWQWAGVANLSLSPLLCVRLAPLEVSALPPRVDFVRARLPLSGLVSGVARECAGGAVFTVLG